MICRRDALMWFDLLPRTPGRRVIEAPIGTDIADLLIADKDGNLEPGWRWITPDEWRAHRDEIDVCEIHMGEPGEEE